MSRKKVIDRKAILQPPSGASAITGKSIKSIRDGCRNGTIPCVREGSDWRVHMPLYLEQIERECTETMRRAAEERLQMESECSETMRCGAEDGLRT